MEQVAVDPSRRLLEHQPWSLIEAEMLHFERWECSYFEVIHTGAAEKSGCPVNRICVQ